MLNPRIEVTDELRRTIQEIDATRERIQARQAPPEEVLEKLEREFIVDTVYHATQIEGSQLTREETERALYPESKPRR